MDAKVVFTYELLEAILLEADMRTVLTAQRVCQFWHSVIKESNKLQVSLFFKPSTIAVLPGQTRNRNPFLEGIWRWVFHQRASDEPEHPKSKAYLRREASWRRMLIQQPPTSHVGILENYLFWGPLFTEVEVKHHDGIRLGLLYPMMSNEFLVAGQDTLFFWFDPGDPKHLLWEQRRKRQARGMAKHRYLPACDFLIFCVGCEHLCGLRPDRPRSRLENWLYSLGQLRVIQDRRRLNILYPFQKDD